MEGKKADEKAARNRGRGKVSGPVHPPKKVGLAQLRLLGRMAGREEAEKDDNIMGDLEYRERKGGPSR